MARNALTPLRTRVRRLFGVQNALCQDYLVKLRERFALGAPLALRAFNAWKLIWRGVAHDFLTQTTQKRDDSSADAKLLERFFVHAYLAQLIFAVVASTFELSRDQMRRLFGATPFDWANDLPAPLPANVASLLLDATDSHAPFAQLYEIVCSGSSRRALGEFYTPAPIARFVYDQARQLWESRQLSHANSIRSNMATPRCVDPCCGAGVFLCAALESNLNRGASCSEALAALQGYDVSPLAVLTSQANLLFTVAFHDACGSRAALLNRLLSTLPHNTLPVRLRDSILDAYPCASEDYFHEKRLATLPTTPFEIALGNPPWLSWERLEPEYRKLTFQMWRDYGLFDLDGTRARLGGGKKELASLMVFRTLDLRLAPHGVLAFLLPKSLLQTRQAGQGFRRFGVVENDSRLSCATCGALELDDFSQASIFQGVATRAIALYLKKEARADFPIPVRIWKRASANLSADSTACSDSTYTTPQARRLSERLSLQLTIGEATPESTSPGATWRIDEPGEASRGETSRVAQGTDFPELQRINELAERLARTTRQDSSARYRAQLGVNAAGASGVFWFEHVDLTTPIVVARNQGLTGRKKVECVEAALESSLLFPLARWRDVAPFCLRKVTTLILMTQDPQTRRGYAHEIMAQRYPLALQYLQRFESQLRARSAYKRYQSQAPFWSLYNVNEDTFARYKVVWRRMDADLRAAAIVEEQDARVILPQETLSMTTVGSAQEADYLCAMLNSRVIREAARRISVPNTKSFGSPSLLNALPIPQFDANQEIFLEIARLSCALRRKCACQKGGESLF
ncbi:MAG: hypothetical protein Q4G03_05105 [Planctomycetia bacterium]|nr:hypothetical protein [Planctomycetia bacterium]